MPVPLFLGCENVGFCKLEKFKVSLSALRKNVTIMPSDLTENPLNNKFLYHCTYKSMKQFAQTLKAS